MNTLHASKFPSADKVTSTDPSRCTSHVTMSGRSRDQRADMTGALFECVTATLCACSTALECNN